MDRGKEISPNGLKPLSVRSYWLTDLSCALVNYCIYSGPTYNELEWFITMAFLA